jgi:hypothetical protein
MPVCSQGNTNSAAPVSSGSSDLYYFSVGISPQLISMLRELAESSGQGRDAVIVKAFHLYKVSVDARREGKAVGIAPTADVLETEFVGL